MVTTPAELTVKPQESAVEPTRFTPSSIGKIWPVATKPSIVCELPSTANANCRASGNSSPLLASVSTESAKGGSSLTTGGNSSSDCKNSWLIPTVSKPDSTGASGFK